MIIITTINVISTAVMIGAKATADVVTASWMTHLCLACCCSTAAGLTWSPHSPPPDQCMDRILLN